MSKNTHNDNNPDETTLDQIKTEKSDAVVQKRRFELSEESDRTLEEIGCELNLTREQVREIEKNGKIICKYPKIRRK